MTLLIIFHMIFFYSSWKIIKDYTLWISLIEQTCRNVHFLDSTVHTMFTVVFGSHIVIPGLVLSFTGGVLSYIPILTQTDWFKHIVHYVYVWRQKNVMFHCVHCACA